MHRPVWEDNSGASPAKRKRLFPKLKAVFYGQTLAALLCVVVSMWLGTLGVEQLSNEGLLGAQAGMCFLLVALGFWDESVEIGFLRHEGEAAGRRRNSIQTALLPKRGESPEDIEHGEGFAGAAKEGVDVLQLTNMRLRCQESLATCNRFQLQAILDVLDSSHKKLGGRGHKGSMLTLS